MNVLFSLIGCPLCRQCIEAVEKVNVRLPMGEKIQIIDILSNDPRTAILAEIEQTNEPYKWRVPLLILEKPVVRRKLGMFYKSNKKRIILHSVLDRDHYYTMVKTIMGVF